jgi:hypothetical protein
MLPIVIGSILTAWICTGPKATPWVRMPNEERGAITWQVAIIILALISGAVALSITDHIVPDWFGQLGLGLGTGAISAEARARVNAKRVAAK